MTVLTPPAQPPPGPGGAGAVSSPNFLSPDSAASCAFATDEAFLASLPAPIRAALEGDDPKALRELLDGFEREVAGRKLETFSPFPKQLEFIAAGKGNRIRLLLAGNRSGKSICAAYETAIHLSGLYPPDWKGHRFKGPITAWVAGVSAQATRGIQQAQLIGPYNRESEWGTGFIPRSCLDIKGCSKQAVISGALDTISVRHVSGKWSTLSFLSFAQGREKFQGTAIDLLWLDEECPEDIFSEGLTRTATTDGITMLTFTPLEGTTPLVQRFLDPTKCPGVVVAASIDDNLSLSKEQIAKIVSEWPEHEREARRYGVPSLGSGNVFGGVYEDDLKVDRFPIPEHFLQLASIDFGFDHPAAAVRLAIDPDDGTTYVTHCYRATKQTVSQQCEVLGGWGANLRWAWPHDGNIADKGGNGESYAKLYRSKGLNMLPTHATHPEAGFSTELGIDRLHTAMLSGTFKVFADLNDWFEEFRFYHRKNGKLVKKGDDLMSATRIAFMQRRDARKVGHVFSRRAGELRHNKPPASFRKW